MRQDHGYMRPVVAASFDHGQKFTQVVAVRPPVRGNWGDRARLALAWGSAIGHHRTSAIYGTVVTVRR